MVFEEERSQNELPQTLARLTFVLTGTLRNFTMGTVPSSKLWEQGFWLCIQKDLSVVAGEAAGS